MLTMSERTARCVVRRDGHLLVEEQVDVDAGERVFVPPGRSLGSGESPEAALEQEFDDLLGVTLTDLRELGEFDDVHVFEGDVEENWLYGEEGFTVYDPDSRETSRLSWLHLDDFRKYGETLRPDGLIDEL
jgi:hypothetical protein